MRLVWIRNDFICKELFAPFKINKDSEYRNDLEENIVSLCSHCHNCIHYGSEAGMIIKKLYYARKELLKKAGIEIGLDDLLKIYGVE